MTTATGTTIAFHTSQAAQIIDNALARRPVETFDIFISMSQPEAKRLRRSIYKHLDRLKLSGVEEYIDKQMLFRAMYSMRVVQLESVPGRFTLRLKVDSSWWNGQVIAAIITKQRMKELRKS